MILNLLKKRSSVRKFSEQRVSQAIIDKIITAGRLAPSGGNEQPWVFGVIDDKSMISRISKIAYEQRWMASAEFLVVLSAVIISDEEGGRDVQKARFPELKDDIAGMDKELFSKINLEEHQTKIPGTQMILTALEYGIGSTWVSYFKVEELAELLNLPDNIIPSEIIAFGYPEFKMSRQPKKPEEELVFYNNFKNN